MKNMYNALGFTKSTTTRKATTSTIEGKIKTRGTTTELHEANY